MFLGRYAHTIDSKGRVSIPVEYRTEFQELGDEAPILTNVKDCLALYPYEAFMEYAQHLDSVAKVDPTAQAFERFMLSGATPCPIDKQGRILIPVHLREYARLERDVVIAGKSSLVEIWNPTLLEDELARTRAQFDQIATDVAMRGRAGGH